MGARAHSRKKRKRIFVGDGAELMGKYKSETITKCYFCKVKTDKLSVDIWSAFFDSLTSGFQIITISIQYIPVPIKVNKEA